MEYQIAKWLHVLSSTILFGTGVGSAFYLLVASLSGDLRFAAGTTRWVVRADWLFTAPTAIVQPATGFWMLHLAGIPPGTRWVAESLALYGIAIACWLPVVWLQMRLRDAAAAAVRDAESGGAAVLPRAYWRLFAWWVALGVPALAAFLAIFWLMVAKPA